MTQPRRVVVSTTQCNTCHGALGTASGSNTLPNGVHNGAASSVESCAVCHDANSTNSTAMSAYGGFSESYQFKRMIHGIHGGAARSASFLQPFCKLGLIPDTGGTWLLPRLVGSARALGLALLGDKLSAEQAAQWGLIWQVVDDASLADTVQRLAAQLAAGPTLAYALSKQAIWESQQHSLAEQLDVERDMMRSCGQSADYSEGLAAFLEKRAPRFVGK